MEIKFNLNDSELYIPSGRLNNHSLRNLFDKLNTSLHKDLVEKFSVDISGLFNNLEKKSASVDFNLSDRPQLYKKIIYNMRLDSEKFKILNFSDILPNVTSEVFRDEKVQAKLKKLKQLRLANS